MADLMLCCSMEDAWEDTGLQTKTSEEWKELFLQYDKDASGAIDVAELGALCKDLFGVYLSVSHRKMLIAESDANSDGVGGAEVGGNVSRTIPNFTHEGCIQLLLHGS